MKKILNVSGENAELLLHGIIGQQISGIEIATQLKALKDLGVKKVTERLNSGGGSIVDGYSIVSANLDLTKNGIIVETINEGVADSMMSVVLASGTRGYRKANDYATSIVHNPLFNGTTLNDIKDESIKKMLQAFKDSLMTIYAASLGKSKEELSETMNEEKMLNAEEMKSFGLIDEVIPTNIDLPITKNMSLAEIMNVYDRLSNFNTNKKENKMSRMNEFYALSKDASEDSLLEAAKAERQKLTDVTEKVENLETDLKAKTDELNAKVKELEKFEDETIKIAVNVAIESGKFDEKDKDELIGTVKTMGIENFNIMVEKMKIPHVDVVDLIKNKKLDKDGKPEKLKYEDLTSEEVAEMQKHDPEKFEAIMNEFNERD